MKNGSRANALLMELLIVILFFMFAATTLVQIFGLSRQRSRNAAEAASAVLEAQNIAESLYDAEDPAACLRELGFAEAEGGWLLENEGYTLRVTQENEETEAGLLRTLVVDALVGEEQIVSLPSARYLEKEAAP